MSTYGELQDVAKYRHICRHPIFSAEPASQPRFPQPVPQYQPVATNANVAVSSPCHLSPCDSSVQAVGFQHVRQLHVSDSDLSLLISPHSPAGCYYSSCPGQSNIHCYLQSSKLRGSQHPHYPLLLLHFWSHWTYVQLEGASTRTHTHIHTYTHAYTQITGAPNHCTGYVHTHCLKTYYWVQNTYKSQLSGCNITTIATCDDEA